MKLKDDRDVCGFGVLSLPPDHPFTPICKVHDEHFVAKSQGLPTPGRRRVDKEMLNDMLEVARARGSVSLRVQSYAYFFIARLVGKIFWET